MKCVQVSSCHALWKSDEAFNVEDDVVDPRCLRGYDSVLFVLMQDEEQVLATRGSDGFRVTVRGRFFPLTRTLHPEILRIVEQYSNLKGLACSHTEKETLHECIRYNTRVLGVAMFSPARKSTFETLMRYFRDAEWVDSVLDANDRGREETGTLVASAQGGRTD